MQQTSLNQLVLGSSPSGVTTFHVKRGMLYSISLFRFLSISPRQER